MLDIGVIELLPARSDPGARPAWVRLQEQASTAQKDKQGAAERVTWPKNETVTGCGGDNDRPRDATTLETEALTLAFSSCSFLLHFVVVTARPDAPSSRAPSCRNGNTIQ